MNGGTGADTLNGGDGDDKLDGGKGADTVNGGLGVDVLSYGTRSAPVIVTLDGSVGDGEVGENDNVMPDVENLIGAGRTTSSPAVRVRTSSPEGAASTPSTVWMATTPSRAAPVATR